MELRNQRGQTLVEYILLLSVAVSLVLTFYNSAAFKRIFGEQGTFGAKIKYQSEFAYRHAFTTSGPGHTRPSDVAQDNKDGSIHPSYSDLQGETRFFGPKKGYGGN